MARSERDRRKALATAATGGALLAAGGKVGDVANTRALRAGAKPRRMLPPVAGRGAPGKVRALYGGGVALTLAGAPAFGVGSYNLVKRDKPFLVQGVEGTVQALQQQQAERSDREVPARVRAGQAAGGAAAALGGGAAARSYFRHAPKLRGPAGPIAGALAATATVPVTNRLARGRGYEITPTGARRLKETPKRPSSKASSQRSTPRSFTADLAKRDTTPYAAQRAAVTGAAGVPLAGPVLAAAAARRFAPPGQKNKHTVRQASVPVAGLAAGVGGAYGAAALAGRSSKVERGAQRAFDFSGKVEAGARAKLGFKPTDSTAERALGRLRSAKSGLVKPLVRSRGAAVGAVVGGLGAKAATNFGGNQTAITLNQRDSKRWRGGVSKQAPPRLSDRQKHKEARQKRRNAAVTQLAAVGSLGAAGLLAAGNPIRSLQVGTASGALGASNALYGAHLQRRDAQRADPYAKNPVAKRAVLRHEYDEDGKPDQVAFANNLRAMGLRTRPMPKTTARPLRNNPTLKRLAQQSAEERERYFQTKRGRAWMRRNGLGRAGTLSWGPSDAKTNTAWRTSQGFGLQRSKPSTGYRGSGKPYGVSKAARKKTYRGPLPVDPKGVRRVHDAKLWDQLAAINAHRDRQGLKPLTGIDVRRGELGGGFISERVYLKRPRSLGKGPKYPSRHHAARAAVTKADNGKDHQDLIRRYGDRGPLPKGLDRDTKIRAYEARYAVHGGHKGEKWQRRANVAEGVRNVGLAGATAAGAAYVGARTPLGRRLAPKTNSRLRSRADLAAVGSATVGGAAELYGEYARGRRASYASAPGGVAASALTRLRANTPKETR